MQMDQLHLTDRVEWDLASPLTPELFASQYILDLGLPLSSAPLIAHAVHEEVLRCKRECFEHGLIGSNTAQQRDVEGIIRRGPRKLEGVWREWTEANNFGPRVEELSVEEIEAAEAERERVAAKCVLCLSLSVDLRPDRRHQSEDQARRRQGRLSQAVTRTVTRLAMQPCSSQEVEREKVQHERAEDEVCESSVPSLA